jgi:NADH pyrophosphatase NudC (nudix superfamily)
MDKRHVVTCFLEHDGKVMFLRRSERVGTYRGKGASVSGYIEEGISPSEQSWTEIKEEAGLDCSDVELVQEVDRPSVPIQGAETGEGQDRLGAH